MPAAREFSPGDGKPKFKGHVESGRDGSLHVELDAGKVMNGVLARLQQLYDAVEPSGAGGDLQSGARNQPEGTKPDDVSEAEVLEFLVVRDIQEDVSGFFSRLWHGYVFSSRPEGSWWR